MPEDLSRWAESRVAVGGYRDPADYVRDVVRRDQEYEVKLAALRAAVEEGRASPETDATVEEIIAEWRARRPGE